MTEEVWRWWQPGSVHRAPWPVLDEFGEHAAAETARCSRWPREVLAAVRRAKTTEKRSMRAKVRKLVVTGPPQTLAAVDAARSDLTDAGGVEELQLVEATPSPCRSSWPRTPEGRRPDAAKENR